MLVDPSTIAGDDFAGRMETLIETIRLAGASRIPSEHRHHRRAAVRRAGKVEVDEASYRALLRRA